MSVDNIGSRWRTTREKNELSRNLLAKRMTRQLGYVVSEDRIKRIERKSNYPDAREIEAFCRLCYCDIAYLITGKATLNSFDVNPKRAARYAKLDKDYRKIVDQLVESLLQEQQKRQ
jgi:transcriptional regulator with XRE-family HTH domain